MDTTPSNTEKEQSTILLENETTSTLFNLQGASYLREDAVTAQVAVKDTVDVSVMGDPAVKDSAAVKPNLVVHTAVEPTVNAPTDNNIPGEAPVTSNMPDLDAVTVEDVFDDDVPLSQFLKVHSKPSISLHESTAHTNASRMSEGVQKKREIKENRGEHKNERQPNELAKGEGLEHVQSEIEGAPHIQALGHESSSVRSDEITQKNTESVRTPTAFKPQSFPSPPRRLRSGGSSTSSRLRALENRCLSMESKLDSMSTMVASGFSTIQEAIQVLSASLDVANLPKGEKMARSESPKAGSGRERSESERVSKQDVAQGEPVSKKMSRSEGEPATKRKLLSARKKRGTKGESGSKGEQVQESEQLFEYEMAGETVLMSKEALEAMQKEVPSKNPILPPVTIREPTSVPKESALERQLREKEEQNRLGKGKDKLLEYTL
ncbi:hypothetical protein POM88_013333 [Heracleum sosnowskyi]|uniref:Uncharacterized protein n=1 Tax=Heracleum sosnowskyi TaxID=360622 RepID=A0AAD8N395_9APIA|nr:hypothetical protein POM88_013333 [Heracleum sosnowskyi]